MMKSLLTILTLVFSVMFSSTSFAEWTEVATNTSGSTYYVDLERIRKHDGFIYYWRLSDHLKPTKYGDLSSKVYHQGDCKLFRFKYLSDSYYKGKMGTGDKTGGSNKPDKEWRYPSPNSTGEYILKLVCSR
jgi:hypothetical protein